MWTTLIFSVTATLFLSLTLTRLWHLHWVRRLPTLAAITADWSYSPAKEPIRCSVVIAARDEEARDDIKLGLLLRRAGKRTRSFLGGNDVMCHWGTTVRNLIKVMEKNHFAALDFQLGLVLAGSMVVILVFGMLVMGLMAGTGAGLAAAFSPLSLDSAGQYSGSAPGLVMVERGVHALHVSCVRDFIKMAACCLWVKSGK